MSQFLVSCTPFEPMKPLIRDEETVYAKQAALKGHGPSHKDKWTSPKRYRAAFVGVNGCLRPGRDSQPFGLGLLIGAAISAVLWAAIGVVVFFPSGATKIASLLAALV